MRLACVLAAASVAVAHGHRGPKGPKAGFDTLVAFGDSYTDNGRLGYYINNGGKAPHPGEYHPVTNVTASGGLSWAQFAAQDAGARLMDYAVSGAVCSNHIVSRHFDAIDRSFPSVMEDEMPSFLADLAFKTLYPRRTAANTVYALWIGTNDLGPDAFLTDSQAPGKTISDYVDCVWAVLDSIYRRGGRRFVLLNTAPLELSPLYAHPRDGGTLDSQFWANKTLYNITEYSYKIKQYTTSVNTMFEYGAAFQQVVKSRWPKATLDLFDVHSLFVDIHNHPAKYLDAPYNVTGYYRHCAPDGSQCTDQTDLGPLSGFMWYDELHPSERTSTAPQPESVPPVSKADRQSRLDRREAFPRCRRWEVQIRDSVPVRGRGWKLAEKEKLEGLFWTRDGCPPRRQVCALQTNVQVAL